MLQAHNSRKYTYLCKALSVPIVISVPQKSLSMDPTKPAIRKERYFCFCSGVIAPKISLFLYKHTLSDNAINKNCNIEQIKNILYLHNLHLLFWLVKENYKMTNYYHRQQAPQEANSIPGEKDLHQ